MSRCADDMRGLRDCALNFLFKFLFLAVILLIICFVIPFIDFLIPHPSLTFTINDAELYAFNVSTTTSTLTSNLHINISCLNNGKYTGFHFNNINVYALYKSHNITLPTIIPSTYVDVKNFTVPYQYPDPPVYTVWSLYLNGTEVLVTPFLAASLVQDWTAGNVSINVKVTARLTSEYGSLSRRFLLKVSCPVNIKFGNENDGNVIGSAGMRRFGEDCNVDV